MIEFIKQVRVHVIAVKSEINNKFSQRQVIGCQIMSHEEDEAQNYDELINEDDIVHVIELDESGGKFLP